MTDSVVQGHILYQTHMVYALLCLRKFFWMQKCEAVQVFSTLIIIRNEQHIIMISEDHVTEDWSNDAANTGLITKIIYILQYIYIENSYFK